MKFNKEKSVGTTVILIGLLLFPYFAYGIYSISYIDTHMNTVCFTNGPLNGTYNGFTYNGLYDIQCSYGIATINATNYTKPSLSTFPSLAYVAALSESVIQIDELYLLFSVILIFVGVGIRLRKL